MSTRDHTTSLQSDNVEDIGEINNSITIEAWVTKKSKHQNSFLTDDERKLSMSKNISRNLRDNFQNNKWKHNVSLKFYHEKPPKYLNIFWLKKNQGFGIFFLIKC